MIYLDHAATAMKRPDQVAEAVAAAMCSTGNSARGAHKASLDASRLIFDTRKKLCQFFQIIELTSSLISCIVCIITSYYWNFSLFCDILFWFCDTFYII